MTKRYEFIVSVSNKNDLVRTLVGSAPCGLNAQDGLELAICAGGADEEIAVRLASQACHSDGSVWTCDDREGRTWRVEIAPSLESQ